MNFLHRRLCSSDNWAKAVAEVLPRRLAGFDLGEHTLEVGPGFGATTRVLAGFTPKLTALEIDADSVRRLRNEFHVPVHVPHGDGADVVRSDGADTPDGERAGIGRGAVDIVHGDGADMPFEDDLFSSVVCFTMLHHVPSPELQDRLFAEAYRVMRPGGLLRAADSQPSLRFRLLHIGDTMTIVDPATLPERLERAGFTDVRVDHTPKQKVEFSAVKPG